MTGDGKRPDGRADGGADALDHSERAELRRLREERKVGPLPHRCDNSACNTTRYGTAYAACPGCGGTAGHARTESAAQSSKSSQVGGSVT